MHFKGRLNERMFFVVAVIALLLAVANFVPGFSTYNFLTSFIDMAIADNELIRPDANGTTGGTTVGCTGGLHFECLNDVVTQPTVPDSSDYIQMVNAEQTYVQMSTFGDIATANAVTIWLYHRDGAANAFSTLALYAGNETTVYAGPTALSSQTSSVWSSITFSGLSLTQAQVDDLRVKIDCEKTGGGKSNDCFFYAMYADVTYDRLIEVTVGATTDTQQNLNIGTTSAHIGGAFTIAENVATRTVTSITIEENGTVNAQTGLDNIKLFYDLDTTAPYDCEGEFYAGTESQFGNTDTDGFSGADGTSLATSSPGVTIHSTQTMCVYPVLDVLTNTTAGQTIEIEINNPTVDIIASGAPDIEPATTVLLPGTTIIQAQDRDQIHYHWRNDDGDETDGGGGATSATGGIQDSSLDTLGKEQEIRLRIGISNEGNRTSDSTQYRLEYGKKVTTCDVVASWTDVGTGGGIWDMFDTTNLTDGNDTTNISVASGGVTNENTTYLTDNNAVKDISSQTAGITLASTEYADLEYSIISTNAATEGDTYCFRVTNAGSLLESYTVYPEATILADVNVTSLGTQKSTVDIPTAGVETGANFVLVDNIAGTTTVQSVTITAAGTVDLQNDIYDIELYYEYDTSAPHNCVGQSYQGTENQFGSTDADGFSGSNTSTFTDSIGISPTYAMCLYVVYSASSTVADSETININIANASTDVVIDSGTLSPSALVDLPGTTVFVNSTVSQVHYHWRDDDGTETGATSATGGVEDTVLENLRRTVPKRLRIGVVNLGGSTTPAFQYRLEYALKTTVCSSVTGWTDVNATNDAFNLFDSANITDGNNSTDISVGSGGVTNVGTTYLTSNAALKDVSSQTANITLPGYNYVDLEYSIVASTTATEGATYCFRVTDAGTPIESYSVYPEVIIKPRTDFFIQRGVTTVSGTSATINAGTQYIAPSASTTAFIRIVGTNNVGAGSPTNTGNADDVTVYVSNPSNIRNSITFTRPATAVDTTRVNWEIIEYVGAPGGDNEIVVRQQQVATYVTGNTTVNSPTVASVVDDSDIVVFITGQRNPDIAKSYPLGLSTAAWNSGTDTTTFTRGASGNTAGLSYAVVEFVGDNWKVQRAQHTYTTAGASETEAITAVNSLSRTFLHAQKRMSAGLTNHSDFGHNVHLSGVGQLTFQLESAAGTPASHTSVAWVVENIQTIGDVMYVSRQTSSESSGAAPKTTVNGIGVTISDTQDASLFINNHANEANGGSSANSFPEPILGAQIISTTQYQTWIADPGGDTRSWRSEVVEWPTAARDIAQNWYQFYVDNDALDPVDPWPPGGTDLGENFEITVDDQPLANGSTTRLRMTLNISSASMDAGIDTFKLQYGERVTSCSAITEVNWKDLGNIGSTTALWRGFDGSPADGTPLSTDPPSVSDLNISIASVAGTYEEQNPTVLVPYDVEPGEDVEYDWNIQHNGAKDKTSYCFRMTEADGVLFDAYNTYPAIRTVGYEPLLKTWRWYDDETNLTPTTPLAGEGVAPVDVVNQNEIKLRLSVREASGALGVNTKFALQYSEYSNFSQSVYTVTSTSTCAENSIWCFADGAGVDNAIIDSTVISDAGTCVSGVGNGCGTYNEGSSALGATYDQPAFSTAEFEFTIEHAGARANAVYYFRLYDVQNNVPVELDSGSSYPSLVTQGAQLVFTVSGVDAGMLIAGQTTDATTTATAIAFNSLPVNQSVEAAQNITIDTNATQGYRLFMYATQQLLSGLGDDIAPITSTNAAPSGWSSACLVLAVGCSGYHSTDASLGGGSGRFGPEDSYAALDTSPQEVMYSSIPIVDVQNILYRIQITENQPIGDYQTSIVYIAVPTF